MPARHRGGGPPNLGARIAVSILVGWCHDAWRPAPRKWEMPENQTASRLVQLCVISGSAAAVLSLWIASMTWPELTDAHRAAWLANP